MKLIAFDVVVIAQHGGESQISSVTLDSSSSNSTSDGDTSEAVKCYIWAIRHKNVRMINTLVFYTT